MRKNAKSETIREAAGEGQLWLQPPALVRKGRLRRYWPWAWCVNEVLEAERSGLRGARYRHVAERQALRAAHVASSLVLGECRVAVSRPRARSIGGRELSLKLES